MLPAARHIKSLALTDARLILRDAFTLYLLTLPVFNVLIVRWLVPLLQARWSETADVAAWTPFIVGVAVLLLSPLLLGVVTGFMLLDERDNGTLVALRVTPMPMSTFLGWRVTVPVLLGALLTGLSLPLTGLVELAWIDVAALALASSITGPLAALFVGALASNKVQGFALFKMLGALGSCVPLAAWMLSEAWLPGLALLFPPLWTLKAFWLALDGQPYALHLVASVALQGLAIAALMRRFVRRADP